MSSYWCPTPCCQTLTPHFKETMSLIFQIVFYCFIVFQQRRQMLLLPRHGEALHSPECSWLTIHVRSEVPAVAGFDQLCYGWMNSLLKTKHQTPATIFQTHTREEKYTLLHHKQNKRTGTRVQRYLLRLNVCLDWCVAEMFSTFKMLLPFSSCSLTWDSEKGWIYPLDCK